MRGEEAADGTEADAIGERAPQQRSGTVSILGGEVAGRGPERSPVGAIEGLRAGEARWEDDQDDSSSSSSSKSEPAASWESRPGLEVVRGCSESLETGAKFRERKLGQMWELGACGGRIGDEKTLHSNAMLETMQSQEDILIGSRIAPRFSSPRPRICRVN